MFRSSEVPARYEEEEEEEEGAQRLAAMREKKLNCECAAHSVRRRCRAGWLGNAPTAAALCLTWV